MSPDVGGPVTVWPLMPPEMLDHYRRGAPVLDDMEANAERYRETVVRRANIVREAMAGARSLEERADAIAEAESEQRLGPARDERNDAAGHCGSRCSTFRHAAKVTTRTPSSSFADSMLRPATEAGSEIRR